MTTTEKFVAEDMFDDLCGRIITDLETIDGKVNANYGNELIPIEEGTSHGGPICYREQRQLVSANSTLMCRARIPALPKGYRLSQQQPPRVLAMNILQADLYLTGPDIDADAPISMMEYLNGLNHELAKKLFPEVEDQIEEECQDDLCEIWPNMETEAVSLSVQFDHDGAWLVFEVWIRE